MMQGGSQQPQSFNVGGNSYQNGGMSSGFPQQGQQQSYQPFSYGNSNPYYGIFSNLSQQQQTQAAQQQAQYQQPVAQQPPQQQVSPPVLPDVTQPAAQQPAQAPMTAQIFDQSANNIAAGLPATGQAIPQETPQTGSSLNVGGFQVSSPNAPAATVNAASGGAPLSIDQWRASRPGGAGRGSEYAQYLKGLGGSYYDDWIKTH